MKRCSPTRPSRCAAAGRLLPRSTLEPGAKGPDVAKLRARLAITEDLPPELADGDAYDMMLTEAVKRFQIRHGLPETGTVGPQTVEALNVPVGKRIRQLAASLDRLNGMNFVFGQRYVVVNIPAAVAEAVEDGKVARRYVTVVGKTDRPSPTLTANITAVNLESDLDGAALDPEEGHRHQDAQGPELCLAHAHAGAG